MTVQELINELNKIEDKTLPVYCEDGCDPSELMPVADVEQFEHRIIKKTIVAITS